MLMFCCIRFVMCVCVAYLSANEQTSSMRKQRSVRVACVTHFSTTFEANLCCDRINTLPRTEAISTDLSSALPCSENIQNTKMQ